MKALRFGNLFLASLALALVMLFGCSSSEESSGGSSSACEDACRSSEVPDFQLEECLASCDIAD
jgi:hypothetical protein